MKATTNKFLLGLLAAGALTLNSCKKEEAVVTKSDNTKATTVSTVAKKQAAINQLTFKMAMFISGYAKAANVGFKTNDEDSIPCLVTTIDSMSTPHTFTLDFGGSTGCKSINGIDYKGNIVVEYSTQDISVVGTSFTVHFHNFTADTMNFDGDLILTNEGPSPAGNPVLGMQTNWTLNFKNNQFETTGANDLHVEMVENDPADDYDNRQIYSGSGSGVANDGIAFTQTITTPIATNQGVCDFPLSGVLFVQSPSLPDRTIDYGSGNCDNEATETVGAGSPTTIYLQ